MFEVYFEGNMVFEGTFEEVNNYCDTHEWDTVLNTGTVEAENMMANGYTWDSYHDHY